MLSRRKFLLLAGGSVASTAYGLSTLNDTTEELSFSRIPVPIKGYTGEPIRLGFLSDIHLGPGISPTLMSQAMESIAKEKPDILLLGGDYLWTPKSTTSRLFSYKKNQTLNGLKYSEFPEAVFSQLSDLLRGHSFQYGAYAVYGNHDRWMDPYICRKTFDEIDYNLLVNEEEIIDIRGTKLRLYGTDDYWTGIPQPPAFTGAPEKDELRIVLSHNPDYHTRLLEMKSLSYHLGLSGHTHGGQICLPVVGAMFYNVSDQRFRSGLTQVGETTIFTSRGIGMVEIPYRINCPPEVSIIDLLPA